MRSFMLAQAAPLAENSAGSVGSSLAMIVGVLGLLGFVAYKLTKSAAVFPIIGGLVAVGLVVTVISNK